MTELDILILVICIAAFVRGCVTGLVMQVATLAGIVLGILFAGTLSEQMSPYVTKWVDDMQYIVTPLSYLISFVLILIVVTIIGRLINHFVEVVLLGMANRLAGGFFCMIKWVLICSVALNIVAGFDIQKKILNENMRENSVSCKVMTEFGKVIMPYLQLERYNEFFPAEETRDRLSTDV